MPSTPLPPDSSSLGGGVLPYLAAVVTGLLGFFGARFTATAPLQASLNDAFRSLMDEWQTERAQHIARISELEAEVLRQRGVINQHLQLQASLQHNYDRLRAEMDGMT